MDLMTQLERGRQSMFWFKMIVGGAAEILIGGGLVVLAFIKGGDFLGDFQSVIGIAVVCLGIFTIRYGRRGMNRSAKQWQREDAPVDRRSPAERAQQHDDISDALDDLTQ